MAGMFAGMAGAAMFEVGTYLKPNGRYKGDVNRILVKNTRKQKKLFIVEFTLTESSNEAQDPVGSKRSWAQDMAQDAAWSSIKGFMYTLFGYEYPADKVYITTKIDPRIETITEEACADANPLKGRSFGVQTVGTITKAAQKEFTRHDFFPVSAKVDFG